MVDDPELQELVGLVAKLCDVPMAMVTVVEEGRQLFLTRTGIDARETPRPTSFCAHAMLGAEPMVVPDAREDARFADNPLVTGHPHIRFYAGAPIINGDGFALGTICLSDSRPREAFEGTEQLAALARQVAALLELRKQLIHQQLAADLAADQRDRLWDSSLDMMLITTTDGLLVGETAVPNQRALLLAEGVAVDARGGLARGAAPWWAPSHEELFLAPPQH